MGIYGKLMELNTVKKEPEKLAVSPVPTEPNVAAKRRLPIEKSSVEASSKEKSLAPPSLPVSTQSEFVGEGAPKQSSDTTTPRYHATEVSRHHDTIVQQIRAAVKPFGKEAATHRYTPEEKQALAEVVFAYHSKGIRTSENEISRIGINFLIEDYRKNGEVSLLEKVLKALNE